MNNEWDRETEVLVVGYGLSGAVAAIEAHDAGARVIILEKGRYPGGLSILSGGGMKCVDDVEKVTTYLRTISGGRVDDELILPFAREFAKNAEYLEQLCQVNGARLVVHGRGDGGEPSSGEQPPASRSVYPLPGGDGFNSMRVAEVPGFHGFPWVQHESPAGEAVMKVVFDNVEKRDIEVLLATTAKRLLTNTEGVVNGVIAQSEGREMTIRANRAVVLATGGFEQNEWMKLQFLQGTPFYSMAPLTHTGDGITMAQQVGAALWHMWHVHGSYGFKVPEYPIAFRHAFSGRRNPKRIMPWIVVDKFGARYMNEYQPAAQDTNHRAMEVLDPDIPGYSRIPSYIIFDEAGRKRGPIANPLAIGDDFYVWSKDNMAEVEKGWILKADSIHELALKLKEMPEDQTLMDTETLETTIAGWNRVGATGKDSFHRPPGTVMPIEVPPFYAAEVWPTISNTQGGPRHNVRQQVIDAMGDIIPHLYAVGELGSFFGHIYELASNLSECLSSGRVAGRCVAAEEPLAE